MKFPAGQNDAIPLPAPADSVVGDDGYGAIFPQLRGDGRGRQIEETWVQLFRALRGSVDATMRASLSAGDIAYRLGELVHNFFRTRGVTLTSFELRRLVVEVLDNYGRGWPSLAPGAAAPAPDAAVDANPASTAAVAPEAGLVRFVEPDLAAPADVDGSTDEAARPAAATIEQGSPLVVLEPRPGAARRRRAIEPPAVRPPPAAPAAEGASDEQWIDLPGGGRRRETLSPADIARLEAAASDAAEAAFGTDAEASMSDGQPLVEATAPAWLTAGAGDPPAMPMSAAESRPTSAPDTPFPRPTVAARPLVAPPAAAPAAASPATAAPPVDAPSEAAPASPAVPPPSVGLADSDAAPAPDGARTEAASGEALYALIANDVAARAAAGPPSTASRGEKLAWLRLLVDQALAAAVPPPDVAARRTVDRRAAEDIFGVGPIESLLRDSTATAVFVNGPSALFVERAGRLERQTAGFRDADHLRLALARLARRAGRSMGDAATPLIEGVLGDGSSVVIVVPPLAVDGPVGVIRRRAAAIATLEDLVACASLSADMAARLREAVAARATVLVCGPRRSGKTTLLGALARTIDRAERVVTVSARGDARFDFDHVVALAAGRGADGRADFAAALAAASRLRPGRLILDDVVDPAAATRIGETVLPDGAILALEASGIADALARLGGGARRGAGVNLAIQTGRTPSGAIRVERIVELPSDTV